MDSASRYSIGTTQRYAGFKSGDLRRTCTNAGRHPVGKTNSTRDTGRLCVCRYRPPGPASASQLQSEPVA